MFEGVENAARRHEFPIIAQEKNDSDGPRDRVADRPVPSGRSEASEVDRAPPQSEYEKQAEKERLRSVVREFVNAAVQGRPCKFLQEKEGMNKLCPTQYSLDPTLRHFTVACGASMSSDVSLPISSLHEIYSCAEDGKDCFPTKTISMLQPEELDLLVMVVYRNNEDKLRRFCILESSVESRDNLLEGLRILHIYARSTGSEGVSNGHAPPRLA